MSETFFENLENKIGKNVFCDSYYETFNNCREQGYVLKIFEDKVNVHIWVCECRNSDDIMVVIGDDKNCDVNNIFDDDAFNRAKYFKCEDYDNAVDYALKYLKVLFEKNFKQQIHIKYDVYRNIDDIRRIQIDADGLDYEDYYELASLYNEDEQYSCDLVISKGKMGYNYNKCIDGHIENLTFMECNPNLENEITLMVDMKENLNKFIYNELSYDLELNNKGISI